VQRVHIIGAPGRGVAVAFEIGRSKAEGASRELAGDDDHLLVHAKLCRVARNAIGDLSGQRSQDEGGEQHHLHSAGAELEVAAAEDLGQLRRWHRLEVGEVHRVTGHGREQCLEEHALQLRETRHGSSRRRHAAGGERDLAGVRWRQQHLIGGRERDRHGSSARGGQRGEHWIDAEIHEEQQLLGRK
jgi:hypothetical protein